MTEQIENNISENEVAEAVTQTTEQPTEQPQSEVVQTENQSTDTVQEISEETFLNWAKSKGKNIESVDDLFKEKIVEVEKIVEKEINPYENASEKTKAFLNYHKETKRDYEDYLELQKDYDKVSPLQLAREKLRLEVGENLTNEQADSYLEKKLNIDLSDESEIDSSDLIDLKVYSKSLLEQKKEEQKKYIKAIEESPSQVKPNSDLIELEDGSFIKKEIFELQQANREKYLNELKSSVNSVTEDVFKVTIDDNGTPKVFDLTHKLSDADKSSALSKASDLISYQKARYESENGLNHSLIIKDIDRTENFGKYMVSSYEKGYAQAVEELMKLQNNVNFKTDAMPTNKYGEKIIPLSEILTR